MGRPARPAARSHLQERAKRCSRWSGRAPRLLRWPITGHPESFAQTGPFRLRVGVRLRQSSAGTPVRPRHPAGSDPVADSRRSHVLGSRRGPAGQSSTRAWAVAGPLADSDRPRNGNSREVGSPSRCRNASAWTSGCAAERPCPKRLWLPCPTALRWRPHFSGIADHRGVCRAGCRWSAEGEFQGRLSLARWWVSGVVWAGFGQACAGRHPLRATARARITQFAEANSTCRWLRFLASPR